LADGLIDKLLVMFGWWFDWQVTRDVWLMVWLTGDWGAEVVSVTDILSTRQSPGALWVCWAYARQSSLRGGHQLTTCPITYEFGHFNKPLYVNYFNQLFLYRYIYWVPL